MTEEQVRLAADEELHRSTGFIQCTCRDGQIFLTQLLAPLTDEEKLSLFKYLANHCGVNILHIIQGAE